MARNIISNDGAQEKVDQLIDDLDGERMEGLLNAKKYQQIKQRQLESEMTRLTEKYGANNPRVQKIIGRLEYNKKFFEAMDLQIDLTKSMAQDYDPDSWRVEGIVCSDQNIPLPGLMVKLVAAKTKELSNNNPPISGTTDVYGFYSITVSSEILGNAKEIKLYLQILDSDGNLLFQDPRVLIPAAGVIDIENVIIPSQNKVIVKKVTRGRR